MNLPTDSPSSAVPGLLMRRTKPGSRESARDEFDGSEKNMVYISGKLPVCYWKWPVIVDLPIENGDFP